MEAIQSAFQLGTVEPHEEESAKFVLRKPFRMNPTGELKEQSKSTSDNFIEKSVKDGKTIIDIYINSPWGTFVGVYHSLMMVSETDEVNLYLNSGVYSEDAQLILSSMSLCKAPIKVHVGYISGFYSACVAVSGTVCTYNKLSAITISSPLEYLTLRGIGNVKQQLSYVENSVKRFSDLLESKGLLTKEEIEEVVLNNKQILLKRENLAERLSNISSS